MPSAKRWFFSRCLTLISLFSLPALGEDLVRWQNRAASTCHFKQCLALTVMVSEHDGHLVTDGSWFQEQLTVARRLFAPLGVGIRIRRVLRSPAVPWWIRTRGQRTALHRLMTPEGAQRESNIYVFITGRLEDVDVPGQEIRGVHWRARGKSEQYHYVVLSVEAPSVVLAHELGHYFGLPHSRFPMSIMNKLPRIDPPLSLRTFAKPEYKHLRRRLRRIFR